MAKKYIEAAEMIKIVNERSSHWLNDWSTLGVLALIDETPAADVEEVRRGEIIKTGRIYPYCSECDCNLDSTNYRRCPWCGAKFDGKKGEKK